MKKILMIMTMVLVSMCAIAKQTTEPVATYSQMYVLTTEPVVSVENNVGNSLLNRSVSVNNRYEKTPISDWNGNVITTETSSPVFNEGGFNGGNAEFRSYNGENRVTSMITIASAGGHTVGEEQCYCGAVSTNDKSHEPCDCGCWHWNNGTKRWVHIADGQCSHRHQHDEPGMPIGHGAWMLIVFTLIYCLYILVKNDAKLDRE